MNIDNFIKNLDLNNDSYIVVGVSSGPDSMALLHILKKNLTCKIVCAHINHNVRTESNEEEQFLKEYCLNNDIIFESYKIDSYQENNFENEARKKRYHFYETILKKYNSHNLFLGHHGDDLIETIMMKIVRGSNFEGYSGIKTIKQLDNYKIIRPLLCLTKDDILKYNKENDIKYYIDKTNIDETYTRNRYRLKLLPILKKEDKNVHLKFLKYSNILTEIEDYLNYETKNKLKTIYINNKIDISLINLEHPFIKKNIIYYILKDIYNNETNIIKEKHLLDILNLTTSKKPNSSVYLPNNFLAKKSYNYISFEKNNQAKSKPYHKLLQKINVIDDIVIKQVNFCDTDGNDVCRLNSKNIKLPLYLRNKLDGDTVEILGLNGKKKIKDIFINEKIDLNKRANYPLLVDSNDTILWIPFIKKSKYNVKKNEFYDIILTSYVKEGEIINEEEKQ